MKKNLLYHRAKKLAAFICAAALVLTLVYIIPAVAENHSVWDGKTNVNTVKYDGGTGSEEDPYLISNGAQLYKMVSKSKSKDGKQYFKLTADIYLNDIAKENWIKGANKWYTALASRYWYGSVFDGAGHTIYGLYLDTDKIVALFPSLSEGAVIGNLTISDAYVRTTNGYAAAITGTTQEFNSDNNIKISCCAVLNSKISGMGNSQTSAAFVGRVVGPLVIENSYVRDCDIKHDGSATDVAAFTGDGWWPGKATIRNSWSSGVYPCAPYKEGNAGFFTCKNVYTDAEPAKKAQESVKTVRRVSTDDLKGENAAVTLKKFDFDYIWETAAGYPELRKKEGGLSEYDDALPGQIWSGTVAKAYAGGTGTEEDPYLISTGGQLALLVSTCAGGVRHKGEYFKLTHNIILNDTSYEGWQEDANLWYFAVHMQWGFEGTLDGDGHIVSGLYCQNDQLSYIYCGIIPVLSVGGVVKNIGLVNSEISFSHEQKETVAGGIVGTVSATEPTPGETDAAIISQCFADSTVTLSAYAAAGIVAYGAQTTEINNCYFTGMIDSERKNLGAIAGFNWSWYGLRINSCYAATQMANGIIGAADSGQTKYTNCYTLAYQSDSGIRSLYYVSKMNGEEAKKNMDDLDFEKIWVTRENETPGLRIFEESRELYSNKHDFDIVDEPRYIEISFVTYTDEVIDSIYTTDFAVIDFPVPEKRFGYEFVGWCTDDTLAMLYPTNIAPVYDITLYAKWKAVGLEQTFENYPATEYDMDYDYVLYKMGVADFSTDYVHSGVKSIHRVGESEEKEDFLLFYEEELQVGKKYTLNFWANTDEEHAIVEASLVHLTWPDINEPNVGVGRTFRLNLRQGKWRQYTCTFTAQSKWIAMRLSGGHSVFLDDFFFYTSGENGTIYNVSQSDGNNTVIPDSSNISNTDTVSNSDTVIKPEDNKNNSAEKTDDKSQSTVTDGKKNKGSAKGGSSTADGKHNYLYLYIIIAATAALNAVAAIMLITKKQKHVR